MERNRTALIVVAAAAAVALSAYALLYSQLFSPSNTVPSAQEYALAERSMAANARMDIALPGKTSWKPGETGLYKMLVANRLKAESTFYAHVYLERLMGGMAGTQPSSIDAGGWFTYTGQQSIAANQTKLFDLRLSVPASARSGVYGFRVVVCTEPECRSLTSSGIYDSTLLNIVVAG